MICFPDTDVVFKLAAFDLFQEALSLLNVSPQDVFILEETRRMCRGSDMMKIYGRQAMARAQAFAQAAGKKAFVIDPQEHQILTLTDGIHAGEAVLFAATKGHTEFVLVTDDKNSLRALAEDTECRPVFDRLSGKVVCLEQLLLWIVTKYEYEQIRHKLLLAFHCVRALQQTFGASQQSPRGHVEAALQAAVDRLRIETNYILVSPEIKHR